MANEHLQKIRGENEAEIRRRVELENQFENERMEVSVRMSQLQKDLLSKQERE